MTTDDMTQFGIHNVEELPGFYPVPGVRMQVMNGTRMMANWVTIDPGAEVPLHSHDHEQLGLVLEGEIEMVIGDERRVLTRGTSYVIASNVPHSGKGGPNGTVVVDIFSPPRVDYLEQLKQAMDQADN